MAQIWNPAMYAKHGSFVPNLGTEVLHWLAPQAGERILDLGCGDGQLTANIAAAGAQVIAVDSSPAMVEAARLRGIDARLLDAEKLSFQAEFDAVFSNAALHWVRDQDAMIAGVKRALKPGGRFVAEMGGHGNIAAIEVALTAVMKRHGLPTGLPVNYYPTEEGYKARLVASGFAVERIQLISRPTPLPASGMRGWLETFRRGVLDDLPMPMRPLVIDETVALLEPFLKDQQGNWTADYVRLRFVALA